MGDVFVLTRNGQSPVTSRKDIEIATGKMPTVISYEIEGSGISASGDLGYVYGRTTINGKEENYLRIWARKGKDWKLMLEALPY